MKFDFLFTYFDGSLKFCEQMKTSAFTSFTLIQKILYHGDKIG